MRQWTYIIILVVILSANILRFQQLDKIPHGYHVDEYAAAVTYQCISTEGITAKREKPGIFIQQWFGTPKPPIYSQLALLWFKIVGFSVGSLRALSALGIVLGVVGLFLLGRRIGDTSVGLWAALAASVSPWSWVLGRLAFESFFAPVFVIWGLYFFFRKNSLWNDLGMGFCFIAAAYIYPPARVFVPLLMAVLFAHSYTAKMKHHWGVIAGWMAVLAIPLIDAQFKGTLSHRLNQVIMWQPEYLASVGKTNSLPDLVMVFLNHFLKHLDPNYLFLKGDADFSHSTQNTGIFSILDIMALGALVVSAGMALWRSSLNALTAWQPYGRRIIWTVAMFLLGIVPAAMTFMDIPNALRMNLSWPFLCLFTGLICSRLSQNWRWAPAILLPFTIFYFCLFGQDYFYHYGQRSKGMFSFWVVDQAKKSKDFKDWVDFVAINHAQDYTVRYHLMHDLGQTCSESYNTWFNVSQLMRLQEKK